MFEILGVDVDQKMFYMYRDLANQIWIYWSLNLFLRRCDTFLGFGRYHSRSYHFQTFLFCYYMSLGSNLPFLHGFELEPEIQYHA